MDPSLGAAFFCLSGAIFLSFWDLRFRRARLERRLGLQPNGNFLWPFMTIVLAMWLMLGPLLNFQNTSSYPIIFLVTMSLAYFRPVRPLSAAATVAVLYPIALLASLLQRVEFGVDSKTSLLFVLGVTLMASFNVLGVWYGIRLRLKHGEEMRDEEALQAAAEEEALAFEKHMKHLNVVELSKLYAAGNISEKEFRITRSLDSQAKVSA